MELLTPQKIFWIALALALRSPSASANSTVDEPFPTTTPIAPPEQTTVLPETTTPPSEQEDPTNTIMNKVFSVQYEILDEKIPKLMADLINTNTFQYNIASQNLINILGLQTITYSNLTRLVDELDVDVDLEEAFGAFNLSVIEILKSIVTNIPDARASTPKILTQFGIDPSEYIWITNFENDTSMFNLLAKGVYTEENFAYALGLANMTEEDVLNLLRPTILEHVGLKNINDLLAFLSRYDLTQRLDVVFEILGIEAGSFYDDPIFSGVLSNLTAILNGEDVLAVAVQESDLLTILGVHTKWYTLDSFAAAYVLSLQNRSLRYEIEGVKNDSLFSIVSVGDDLGGHFFRKAEYEEYSPENYVDCQCVGRIEQGEFLLSDVRGLAMEGDALVRSTNGTICSLGSPLICSGSLLFGLSVNAVVGSPKFLTFKTQAIPPTFVYDGTIIVLANDPVVEENSSGGLSVGGSVFLAVLVLQTLIIAFVI